MMNTGIWNFGSAVLLLLAIPSNAVVAWQLTGNGDCLDFKSYDFFRFSPWSTYDPKVGLEGRECARICSESQMPHAALVGKKFCLCAPESETTLIDAVPRVTDELCDDGDYYMRYFRGEFKSEIRQLTIQLRKPIYLVEEEVVFDLSAASTGNLEFSIDFGDGSDRTPWSAEDSFHHQYRTSGTFLVTAEARVKHKPSVWIRQVLEVKIHNRVKDDNLKMICPRVVEPDDKVDCNILVLGGTDMQMKINFGDGHISKDINLPDVPMKSVGISIPLEDRSQVLYEETEQLPKSDLVAFPIPEDTLSLQGSVQGIEGYGAKAGQMFVHILRKFCDDEQDCLGSTISCFEPGALCSATKTCHSDCQPFYKKTFKYRIVKTFDLSITVGPFFLKSQSSFRLLSEDLVAFRMQDAQLSYRKIRPNEVANYKIEMPDEGTTTFVSNKFKMIDDRKYFLRLIVSEPLNFTMTHVYQQSGRYPINFVLRNEFDRHEISRTSHIHVQSTISKMRLMVKPPNAAVAKKIDIVVQLNKGSNIQLGWDFGDGNQTIEHIPIVRNSQKFSKEYYYYTPGIYHITTTASNLQGNTSAEHIVTVEYPVLKKFWKITNNSPVLLPGLAKFLVTYPTEEQILPTNATFFMIFGDGQRHIWNIPHNSTEWDGEYEITHMYEKSGLYNIDVDVSNVVSKIKRRFQVEVMRKIVDLKAEAKNLSPRQIFKQVTEQVKHISLNSTINFNLTVGSGDVEHYLIEINDELYKQTEQSEINITFSEPGIYNLKFFGYNHIQNLSDPYIQFIHVFEPVQGLEVTDISNDTLDVETKYFTIEMQSVGTNSCLLIDFGERSKANDDFHTFGDYDHCLALFGKPDAIHNETLTGTMHINRKYGKPKKYIVKMVLANLISRLEQIIPVTVIEIDCKPPILKIKNQIEDWKGAIKVWRSKPVQLYSKTFIDCNATFEAFRFWNAYRLDVDTGQVVSVIDLSNLDSYAKSFLYVPAFYLKPGVYEFQFGINMTCPYLHPVLPLTRTSSTYVEVVPSPIIARLTEGAQSRIVRGWGQKISLWPRQSSIDPDDEFNKNFEIKWFCRRLPDEQLNNLLPDERQNFSSPIYDRSMIDEEWGDDDGGGCFGQGPGRINITNDEIEWNTTVFRKPDETYELAIQIIPPDREPSWGAIQLNLLKTQPPSVVVQCQTKALCYPHFPIGQKINPVRVGLEGKCKESCDGELKYRWDIYGVDNGTDVHLTQAMKYVVGMEQPKMALGLPFFEEYYPRYKDFFARLTVTNERRLKGESDIFLHINQPPEGGECVLKYTGTRALIDRFIARCSMWIDPEDKPIEYYGFWIKNLADGIVSYLMYGPDRRVQLILPYGNFTIGVDIRDKEGALTKVVMANITTELPAIDEYEQFMNSRALEKTDASGDQSLMNMIAQALSSLLNINFGSKSNGTSTTTTTTTTTTTASYDYVDESQLEREAQTKAKIVKSVATMMNADTLNSLEQIGSALTALAGKGKGVDNDAKEIIIKLLNKTVSIAAEIQVESPQQLLDFCRFAVGTMGGIVNRMSEQIVSGVVLPTDKNKGWNLDYSVEVPDVDDEPDYIMDAKTSIEDALKKAVIRAERQAAELQIRQMIELTINLVLAILKNIVVGEEPVEFAAPSGLVMTLAMYPKGSISNKVIQHGDSTYVFPHVCDILIGRDCFGNETMGVLAVSWPAILESFGNSVDLLSQDSKTLQLLVINETLGIVDVHDTTKPFSIVVPRKSAQEFDTDETDLTYVVPKLKFYESMIYHQIMIEKADSAMNIEIKPTNPESDLLLFIKYREKPLFDYYDIVIPLKSIKTFHHDSYNIFLTNKIIQNRTGFFYVGVVEVDRNELASSPESYLLDDMIINDNSTETNYTITNYTLPGALREYSTNYSMRIFTSGCYFYNYHKKIWSAEGCLVEGANFAMTHCKCNHLTSFGSGFFVMPNSIDFSYVFANAGFQDNATIYMTIAVTLTLYAVLLAWARKNDKEDLMKLGSTPLPDNDPTAKYLYEIIVYTGDKDEAATDSKIQFILSGEDEETGVRTLEDPFQKAFRRGDTNSFVMATPKRLGRLNYIRIWHDNSGEGKFRSWFLSFIVVKDIQTGEKYEFICNRWLAVEKEDGAIDRLLPVASHDEATKFTHLFQQTTQKNLADGHLWFSIFMRPPRSRFTRVQRVTSCMALLYLSMLVNAMWYQRVPSKPSGSSLEVGPFSLSPEQIGVGIMSNIIVFPMTFLIIICFRKARLRKLRPSRITEALKKQKVFIEQMRRQSTPNMERKNDNYADLNKTNQLAANIGKGGSATATKKQYKRFTLPHYFRYVGWALSIISIAVSIFFLWAYGIQFGDEKTRKWITSLIISFFASILVTQPIKVFLTAIILATLLKSPDVDIDDSEEDEDDIDLSLLEIPDEWNDRTDPRNYGRSQMYRSPKSSILDRIKQQRLKEIKIIMILKDIFSYMCFLWILTVIGYGNRDPAAYLMKETLVKTVIDDSVHRISYMNIKTSEEMWQWVDNTLINNLLIGEWYNGYKPLGLRGFMNDRVNRMMGYGILRQIRIKPNTCKPEKYLERVIDRCRAFSSIIHEDRMSYLPGWREPSEYPYVNESVPRSKSGQLNPSKSLKDEWNYRSASELDGFSFMGKLDIYSGGGYVIPLKGSREQIREKILRLRSQNWIDERTRAVIAEFSVYNAQANLFGIVSCVHEFQPGGGIIPNYRIDVIRLMRHHQGGGLFVILCEIIYLIFIIYFTVREAKFWKQQGRMYLRSYWNWAELFIITLSYAAVGLYIHRIILTNQILSVFHESHGNGYVKLQYVTMVDELFGYLLAFIVFVGILKFIKLFRFNKRMGVLYATLAQCSKDLKSFSIVFCTVFFAFVQMFYLLFGVTMKEYSSFINAAETTFGMVTGKFDFDSMVIAAPVLGPIVFFIFVLCTSIILVNVFLTLIISAFETVKHDVMKQDNEYEIMEFMFKKFKNMLGIYSFPAIMDEDEVDEKEKQMKMIEEQIEALPHKVEQLRRYMSEKHGRGRKKSRKSNDPIVYDVISLDKSFNGKHRFENQRGNNARRNVKRFAHTNSNGGQVEHGPVQKISFLDWNEIQD